MHIVTLVLMLAACAYAGDNGPASEGGRQKRLLFFDEGGSLVRTYPNPYMNQLSENGQNLPYYGNFLNPFFNFIRHFGSSLVSYTIPVSDAIIQAIKIDPTIQNTLVVIPKKDPVVAPNTLCEGKRTQIPSPNLCSNFLNCWDGWAFEQECPAGLMFSSNGYCDYADNVDCNNRKVESGQPQLQPVCSKDFEAFRSKTNCNEFFVCVNRQPVRFQCPANLAYSQILGVCDYADRVDCSSTGSSIVPVQPAYPTPAPIGPLIPPSPVADTPVLPQEIPAIPQIPAFPSTISPETPISPEIPTSPEIPSSSEIPSLPEIPSSSEIPSLPEIPTSPSIPPSSSIPTSPVIPALPVILPSSPVNSPQSPTIPPAPAAIPPLPSLLPPGTVFPSLPPGIYPAQRPISTPVVYPAPITDVLMKPKEKLVFSDFFNPGCSGGPANVAMSRMDAIKLLQKAIATNYPY